MSTTGTGGCTADPLHIPFENTYAALPGRFYARQLPTHVTTPRLTMLNVALGRANNVQGKDPVKKRASIHAARREARYTWQAGGLG